jgi:hypothetical protein
MLSSRQFTGIYFVEKVSLKSEDIVATAWAWQKKTSGRLFGLTRNADLQIGRWSSGFSLFPEQAKA